MLNRVFDAVAKTGFRNVPRLTSIQCSSLSSNLIVIKWTLIWTSNWIWSNAPSSVSQEADCFAMGRMYHLASTTAVQSSTSRPSQGHHCVYLEIMFNILLYCLVPVCSLWQSINLLEIYDICSTDSSAKGCTLKTFSSENLTRSSAEKYLSTPISCKKISTKCAIQWREILFNGSHTNWLFPSNHRYANFPVKLGGTTLRFQVHIHPWYNFTITVISTQAILL